MLLTTSCLKQNMSILSAQQVQQVRYCLSCCVYERMPMRFKCYFCLNNDYKMMFITLEQTNFLKIPEMHALVSYYASEVIYEKHYELSILKLNESLECPCRFIHITMRGKCKCLYCEQAKVERLHALDMMLEDV